ncbi:MAG: sigma-54-dependent Fis family transcriptional regulator, partial [Proteobacteria bacterium]|nr:sigma-54-dependent Fis family transcriptional regulator [Pseudomonadota bacterium]
GGAKPVKVDIRVIATTNKDLKAEVSEGRFREDLFYRLNVFPFVLPPLRERPDDIKLLSDHFLTLFADRYSKPVKDIEDNAFASLLNNPWRGNVRELENVMERAVLMSSGESLTLDNLYYGEEPPVRSKLSNVADKTIKEMEKELILMALKDTEGNKTKAAKKLGISIRTLRNKLKEYSVEEESSL